MESKLKKKINKKSGFTLIEVLAAMAILVLIFGALSLFARNIWVYNAFISTGLGDTEIGRKILKTMISEIRTASVADTGAHTISQAGVSSFTFYSDIDSDGLKEKVRYFLSGTEIRKGVIKPTGSPLIYNPLNEEISVLTSDVINMSFEYYDKNYDGTTAPLSSPINIADIRLVKVTVVTDKDPNRPPAPTTFSTQVFIRNLKDNL